MILEKDKAIDFMDGIETSIKREGSLKPTTNTKNIIENKEPISAIKEWIKKTFSGSKKQVFFQI